MIFRDIWFPQTAQAGSDTIRTQFRREEWTYAATSHLRRCSFTLWLVLTANMIFLCVTGTYQKERISRFTHPIGRAMTGLL